MLCEVSEQGRKLKELEVSYDDIHSKTKSKGKRLLLS